MMVALELALVPLGMRLAATVDLELALVGGGRRGDTEELPTKIVCRGCPRPLLYKFHAPFCCGACAIWCAGSQADRHGAQRRHGRDCAWGAIRVNVWRTAGQNHAHLADGE